MRFVSVKSEAKQASAVIFRTRDVLVGQRTQLISAIRGQLSGYGLIAPQGLAHIERLIARIEDPASDLPQGARACPAVLVEAVRHVQQQTTALDAEIAARAKADETARRLMSVPGIGPLIATAIEALAPPSETFRSARDFAAWIGLTPVQRSTGAKERPGRAPGAWASGRCAAFLSSPRVLSCAAPSARTCQPAPGLGACWPASRRRR